MTNALKVIVGAAIGGFFGYHAFFWVLTQGFYGLVLPGGLLAIGAGFGKNRSVILAVVCGLAAIALGLYTEWRSAPFKADGSFEFFLRNMLELRGMTLIMIALGGGLGFYIPYRQALDGKSRRRAG